MRGVDDETRKEGKRMMLSGEVSMVGRLHVCAVGAAALDGFEDTDEPEATSVLVDQPINQVKEVRERNIRLTTEHCKFEIVAESEVQGNTARAARLDDFGKSGGRSRLMAKEFNTYKRTASSRTYCPFSKAAITLD